MKQILQYRKNGDVGLHDVPPPRLGRGGILVRNMASLISAGTEKAGIELTQKSMVGMAQERPDLVRRVLDKVQKDGFAATWNAVRDQLDRYVPLGYSCAGIIEAKAADVDEFEAGQLVACAGAGHACHAEYNFVPRLLAARAPERVTAEQACYATVGAIALQGIRNADVKLGETVAVIGLGLIGQLAVQILKASGCRVIGFDVSEKRAALAQEHGAIAAFAASGAREEGEVARLTRGRGVDAVLITAATKSNAPVEFAARISRDRGKVVMVGVTGMDLPRNDYYHKELSLTVSRSYGPGRYDANYEERGHDYPIGHVRWTEQRNLEAFLDLIASGDIRPDAMTTHRFPIADADQAYELILTGSEPHMGVVLEYPAPAVHALPSPTVRIQTAPAAATGSTVKEVGVSFLGAGNFARGVLLRHLKSLDGVRLQGMLSASGHTAATTGKKFGFQFSSSEVQEVLDDPKTDLVVIATRHSLHADLAGQAVAAGKAVFIEKPLAVNLQQLKTLMDLQQAHQGRVMVGFNRRFAPLGRRLRDHFAKSGPVSVQYRVSAGSLPHEHWLAAPEEGGRIIGEGCHFVDFFSFLTGSVPVSVFASPLGANSGGDGMQVMVNYENGSVCNLNYCATGAVITAKERVEVLGGSRSGILNDFRGLDLDEGSKHLKGSRAWFGQDKGHREELRLTVEAVRSGAAMPISFNSLVDTTLVTLAAMRSASESRLVPLAELRQEVADA